MSPINFIAEQQRGVTIGRVRTGHVIKQQGKKDRPAKLRTFRLTSPSEAAIRSAAAIYGGEPFRVEQGALAGQWDVTTDSDRLAVGVASRRSIQQWMELWTAGGCQRRCDGDERWYRGKVQGPCLCPTDDLERADLATRGEACRMTTRVEFILPDVMPLGVFMLESHGRNVALEMAGQAEIIAAATERGQILPAHLVLQIRTKNDPHAPAGQQRKEFAVPVLEILATPRQLVEGASADRMVLPPAPAQRAISAAPSRQPAPTPAEPENGAPRPSSRRPARPAAAPEQPPAAAQPPQERPAPPPAPQEPPQPTPEAQGAARTPRDVPPELLDNLQALAKWIAEALPACTKMVEVIRWQTYAKDQGILDEYVPPTSGREDEAWDPLSEVLAETGRRIRRVAGGGD